MPQQPQMPYEGSGGNSSHSRYLEIPNYATMSNRYSLDSSAVTRINDGLTASINSGSAATAAAAGPNAPAGTDHLRHHHRSASNFARQHSWDSPVQFRRRQYG